MSKEVSKYVSYNEVIHSNTAIARGINNEPSEEQLELIRACAINIFDKIREAAGGPVKINSVFRSDALNVAIGGSKTSQHSVGLDTSKNSYGAAFDLDDNYYYRDKSNMDNCDMFNYIKNELDYDQLIWEFGDSKNPKWVHVSYRPDGKNRKMILIALKNSKGKTYYVGLEGNEDKVTLTN